MAKITLEFDEEDAQQDLDLFIHRYELIGTLREVDELLKSIYKGWHNLGKVLIRDGKTLVLEEDTKKSDYDYHGVTEYVNSTDVMDKLDTILTEVYRFLR